MLELKQLQFFVVSADTGSFKGAAQALYTSQSHVSKTIKALETEMQTELFIRKSGGVELTEAGKKVYGLADAILRKTEALHQSGKGKNSRKLYISSVSNGRLAEIFAQFCQTEMEGDIDYRFLEETVEEMLRHIHRHVSEIGFVYISMRQLAGFIRQLEDKKLEFVRMKKTGPCLLVGRKSPLYGLKSAEPSVLREIKLVQPEEDAYSICACPGYLKENFPAGYGGQVVVRTNSIGVMADILNHTNMGAVSCNMPPGRQGQLRAVQLNGLENSISFGYIKRKKDDLSPVAKRFIAYVVKMLE